MVGLVGLEPTASSSRTKRATNCATTRYRMVIPGGPKRVRTADLFHAMEALYQLSYGPACPLVDLRRVELLTSTMRM